MEEELFNYTETTINKDDKVIFVNSGNVDADLFEIIRALEDDIETYVNLRIITDAETAEQLLVALNAHLEEEEYVDPTDEDAVLPVMITDVNKLIIGTQKVFLVTVTSTDDDSDYVDEDDEEDEDEDEATDESWD